MQAASGRGAEKNDQGLFALGYFVLPLEVKGPVKPYALLHPTAALKHQRARPRNCHCRNLAETHSQTGKLWKNGENWVKMCHF